MMMMTPNKIVPEITDQKTIDQLCVESEQEAKLISHLQKQKSKVILESERIEAILFRADKHFAKERHQLINSLRHHDVQILEKETSIRALVSGIADSEMKRNIMSDELEESTLRTIEIINISDIRIERENLEREVGDL